MLLARASMACYSYCQLSLTAHPRIAKLSYHAVAVGLRTAAAVEVIALPPSVSSHTTHATAALQQTTHYCRASARQGAAVLCRGALSTSSVQS
jgi:hypothetical protein